MLDENSVALSRTRLKKAHEDLRTAEIVKDAGIYNAANNRAYYAIFHAIRAALALDSVDFKSHSKVIGYFNKNYVHNGVFG
jgi:uncharacterized protein (UPF0332 family)